MTPSEIFLAAPPGLEPLLADEAREAGFAGVAVTLGGVTLQGGWAEVRRANLELAGASRVLARVAEFPAVHLAQLDKRARKLDWAALLRPGVPVKVEASCRASKIYHAGAAAQRVEQAIADAQAPATEGDDPIRLMVRIERNLVTISVDTSGAPLHRRGFKEFVGKAPLRETMAALFLRACGWDGTRPLVDPMCGSGTILLEGAALAAGLQPGRGRGFAWQRLAPPELQDHEVPQREGRADIPPILGFDRDDGAVRGAGQNVERAGLSGLVTIARAAISDLVPPPGPPGLVLTNPPYGARIGKPGPLHGLYATLGKVLTERFRGWEAGILTSEPGLARTTGLAFTDTGPLVPHGPLKIRLYCTGPLP